MGSTEVKRMEIGTQMHPTHNYTVIHSRTLNKIMEKYCTVIFVHFPIQAISDRSAKVTWVTPVVQKIFLCVK